MNLHRSIISLEDVMNPWDVTEREPSLTDIPPNVIFFGIEGIWCKKEDLGDNLV